MLLTTAETDQSDIGIPVFDLEPFLKDPAACKKACKSMASELETKGVVIVKDPRVDHSENDTFMDMMEKYFEMSDEEKDKDVRADLFFQVGRTPKNTEKARVHCERIKNYPPDQAPLTECPPEADPKERWFHPIGERPAPGESKYKALNADAVIPEKFGRWKEVMDRWGNLILGTVQSVAQMAALGFDLDQNAFTDLMHKGAHLLAPTGSDMTKLDPSKAGQVFASFHYDLNFITIHGRSRFPGLFVWTRDGRKVLVKVPQGCLLLQAGKQFEWVTGGKVLAGFHEVVVVPETLKAIEERKKEGLSLWRISSTLFAAVNSDKKLEIFPPFKTEEAVAAYPPIDAGEQVQQELKAIGLAV
uniref:Non-haem dioxygenase N-terminal domain-containing protein n=1 Tax=Chromera velia CCMP2878 TaxID=1169474 RepID=A0A0G4HHA0_9ALVE|mmetsp:Transcript_48019/g.94831  ORF Transcript_48019/g.94831 Transcript_48019/m.94831 type:complete len:359 (+) Transcript_48019:186-1262(+)|eukprot:Cvel_6786.t1-p1 / transcript=Cvel_6786.t1 / gene=Cvel_6786 / organism=Chromera_velia_CCMP2878 / gene_product=hypothetical protein / transcript_product=hypothetical protein / location=Cvel_scaffold341:18914-22466(-) / protein_length=358 / sequence_SO=supercontig / SO=protein_coding / is_pseudo=false